jgi:hypothetical protein
MASFVSRRIVAATATGLLLALFASSAVSAAPRPITFDVFIGDYCVSGRAPNNSFLKLVIRDKQGNLKGRGSVDADPQGYWQACLGPENGGILPGDSINARVFDSSNSRTFTVPLLTGKIDRGTNVVSGRAPAGSRVQIEAYDFRWDLWGESYDLVRDVTAAGGTYAHDFDTDGIDVRGGASVAIRWSNAGDTVHVGRFQIAPYISLQIGRHDMYGASTANGLVRVTLKSGSTKVATASGVGSYGDTSFIADWADADGEPYTLRGGEILSAPALGGHTSWRVPQINPVANLAADTVSGTCFPNGRVMALAQDPSGFGYGLDKGEAGANGKFTINLAAQVNIRKGFRLAVLCYAPDGDEVVQEATAR